MSDAQKVLGIVQASGDFNRKRAAVKVREIQCVRISHRCIQIHIQIHGAIPFCVCEAVTVNAADYRRIFGRVIHDHIKNRSLAPKRGVCTQHNHRCCAHSTLFHRRRS